MRWKTTFTSLLAVLLLLTSSAASACHLRCNAIAAQASCHGMQSVMATTTATAHTEMDGMSNLQAAPIAHNSCAGHICTQQVARVQQRGAWQLPLSLQTASPQLTAPKFYEAPITTALVAETPPLAKDSPVTLRTTLRV